MSFMYCSCYFVLSLSCAERLTDNLKCNLMNYENGNFQVEGEYGINFWGHS